MNASSSEIDDALRSRQHIARENFVRWIEPASELETLAKLHYLASTAYDRIQPELGLNVACTLALRYFLECVKTNVQHSGMIESRFGATQNLLDWFYHLAEMDEGQSAILTQAASAITEFYLASNHEVQDAIENGLLKHALEIVALRLYFEHWSADRRLSDAWKRALKWGEAHPNYTWNQLKELHKMQLGPTRGHRKLNATSE
jgi:hypothetical protein